MTKRDTQSIDLLNDIANPTRWRIMEAIKGQELRVQELCDLLHLPQPSTSHHLGILRRMNVVNTRRHGKMVYYRALPGWADDAMDALRAIARETLY